MKEKNRKKIVISSALVAGAALGGAATMHQHSVNATSGDTESREQQDVTDRHERPELSEEKKAEIKEMLENMTEEEREAWKEAHKKAGRGGRRHEKPEDMTDEEWEEKKAEHQHENIVKTGRMGTRVWTADKKTQCPKVGKKLRIFQRKLE